MIRMFFAFLFGVVTCVVVVLLISDRQIDVDEVRGNAAQALSEATVMASVKTALALQKDFELFGGISVDVDDRVVTLTGRVSTPEQRQLAELISKGVDGVDLVINKIEVRDTQSHVPVLDARTRLATTASGSPPRPTA